MQPTLVVLAAGIGSRYGGLKQLDPVGPGDEPIMDYSLYDALRAGFMKFVFVIRREMEGAFHEAIGSKVADRAHVVYAYQELHDIPSPYEPPPNRVKPWGTGHALLSAKREIDGPFAMINADDFYGADAYKVMAKHLKKTDEYAMVGFTLSNTLSPNGTVARGVCTVDGNGHLTHVEEHINIAEDDGRIKALNDAGEAVELPPDAIVSMNMWGFRPRFLDDLREEFKGYLEQHAADIKREFYLPLAITHMMDDGRARVRVLQSHDPWFGVTYQEDKAHVQGEIRKLVDAGVYPERLWG